MSYVDAAEPAPIPENANREYVNLDAGLQNLINALQEHPTFQANVEAYSGWSSTPHPPPEARNKIYFMWDFVCRTRYMLRAVDPTLPPNQEEQWSDVVQRAIFQDILIHDTTGKLSMMVGEKPGEEIDFGDRIRKASKEQLPELQRK